MYWPRRSKLATILRSPSLSTGSISCLPPTLTRIAACRIGHTRNWVSFRGWNWTLRIGDGNRYLFSQSPVNTSNMHALLSVDADKSLWPLLDQDNEQIGWTWAEIIFAIPRVRKSQITMRPSLHPTARSVPYLLKQHVTASEIQSKAPSYSSGKFWQNDSKIKRRINEMLKTNFYFKTNVLNFLT